MKERWLEKHHNSHSLVVLIKTKQQQQQKTGSDIHDDNFDLVSETMSRSHCVYQNQAKAKQTKQQQQQNHTSCDIHDDNFDLVAGE